MLLNSQLVCLRPVGVLLCPTSFCAINIARVNKGNVIIIIVIITIIIVIAVNVIVFVFVIVIVIVIVIMIVNFFIVV